MGEDKRLSRQASSRETEMILFTKRHTKFIYWRALEEATLAKKRRKVGGRVFCNQLSVKLSFRLPDHYNLSPAEVGAINVTVDILLRSTASSSEVNTLIAERH